jgi:hypothetical protein
VRPRVSAEQPGKADLVTVGVRDMKKPFIPGRIARRRLRLNAGRDQPPVQNAPPM